MGSEQKPGDQGVIAVDGKTLRRSHDRGKGKKPSIDVSALVD